MNIILKFLKAWFKLIQLISFDIVSYFLNLQQCLLRRFPRSHCISLALSWCESIRLHWPVLTVYSCRVICWYFALCSCADVVFFDWKICQLIPCNIHLLKLLDILNLPLYVQGMRCIQKMILTLIWIFYVNCNLLFPSSCKHLQRLTYVCRICIFKECRSKAYLMLPARLK